MSSLHLILWGSIPISLTKFFRTDSNADAQWAHSEILPFNQKRLRFLYWNQLISKHSHAVTIPKTTCPNTVTIEKNMHKLRQIERTHKYTQRRRWVLSHITPYIVCAEKRNNGNEKECHRMSKHSNRLLECLLACLFVCLCIRWCLRSVHCIDDKFVFHTTQIADCPCHVWVCELWSALCKLVMHRRVFHPSYYISCLFD